MERTYFIKNENESVFVSEILTHFLYTLETRENVCAQNLKCYKQNNVKDIEDIILSFSISLSAGIVLEILKYWILKFKNRDNYNNEDIIEINGVRYTLGDIENGSSNSIVEDEDQE